jgi:hypothetical protein
MLHHGLTEHDRVALETYRAGRAPMDLIREAVEDCAPPGSVTRADYLTPGFTVEAAALIPGIYAIAGRRRPASKTQTDASATSTTSRCGSCPIS